ncbi:MAG: hypothetical protein ACP5JU_00280 [Minisyncoccia bacterium]
MNKGQILIEALLSILLVILLSLSIFIIFNTIPNVLRYSEESLIFYNLNLNYQNILYGIARENFSKFDELVDNIDYYFVPTSTGFDIQEGREEIDVRGEKYYIWFQILDLSLDEDPNKKLMAIFIQTPSLLYKSNLILTRWNIKAFLQENWTTPNIEGPLTTINGEYATKSPAVEATSGKIWLP